MEINRSRGIYVKRSNSIKYRPLACCSKQHKNHMLEYNSIVLLKALLYTHLNTNTPSN